MIGSISKPEEMANAFNQYLTSISAPTTSDNVDSTEFETLLSEFTESRSFNTPPLFVIPPITGSIVEQDLRTISLNKATGLDGISIRLLKSALPAISPSLENIYNASISSGIFPDAFKKAKVTPVHKKESTHQRGNFRPISVLPILSKPLERHVSLAFHEHLKTNKLLYNKNKSTLTDTSANFTDQPHPLSSPSVQPTSLVTFQATQRFPETTSPHFTFEFPSLSHKLSASDHESSPDPSQPFLIT